MAFDLEKLAQITEPRSECEVERAKARKENREWMRMSQDIALCLHYYLRNSGLTQKDLADKMGVSAAYIGKLLKGGENLTLETICKIQKVTGEKLISVFKPYVKIATVTITAQTSKSPATAFLSDKFTKSTTNKSFFVQNIDVA